MQERRRNPIAVGLAWLIGAVFQFVGVWIYFGVMVVWFFIYGFGGGLVIWVLGTDQDPFEQFVMVTWIAALPPALFSMYWFRDRLGALRNRLRQRAKGVTVIDHDAAER